MFIKNLIFGKQRYKFIVLNHELTYFVKHKTKGKKCYIENIISMLEILIDNIFAEFGWHFFIVSSTSLWEQTAPLFLSIFFYTTMRLRLYKNLSKKKKIHKLKPLIGLSGILMMFFSINKPNFANWIKLINPQRIWDKENKRNSFPMTHFLTFTSNLILMVNFIISVLQMTTDMFHLS